MNALEHFREGERLLALAKDAPLKHEANPTVALQIAAARAHFEAAQTLIAAINALDMPAHNYEAWQKIALASQQAGGTE